MEQALRTIQKKVRDAKYYSAAIFVYPDRISFGASRSILDNKEWEDHTPESLAERVGAIQPRNEILYRKFKLGGM